MSRKDDEEVVRFHHRLGCGMSSGPWVRGIEVAEVTLNISNAIRFSLDGQVKRLELGSLLNQLDVAVKYTRKSGWARRQRENEHYAGDATNELWLCCRARSSELVCSKFRGKALCLAYHTASHFNALSCMARCATNRHRRRTSCGGSRAVERWNAVVTEPGVRPNYVMSCSGGGGLPVVCTLLGFGTESGRDGNEALERWARGEHVPAASVPALLTDDRLRVNTSIMERLIAQL
nr:hypothetical protein CFP56_30157 [Quercus suber]